MAKKKTLIDARSSGRLLHRYKPGSLCWHSTKQKRMGWDNKQRGESGSEGQSAGNGLPSIGTEPYGVAAFVNKSGHRIMARGRSIEGDEAVAGHLPAK